MRLFDFPPPTTWLHRAALPRTSSYSGRRVEDLRHQFCHGTASNMIALLRDEKKPSSPLLSSCLQPIARRCYDAPDFWRAFNCRLFTYSRCRDAHIAQLISYHCARRSNSALRPPTISDDELLPPVRCRAVDRQCAIEGVSRELPR